jgi:glutathione S-transferase
MTAQLHSQGSIRARGQADGPFRLVTIPFSHYCEKARWALQRLGVDYVEDGHLPLLHWPAALRSGGHRTVPVLVSRAGVFADSTDILRYLDRLVGPEDRLYPEGHAAEVMALEEEYDQHLGPHTRRWAYQQILPRPDLVFSMTEGTVPDWERHVLKVVFPVAAAMMRRGMNITAETAELSLERTRQVFAEVAHRLSDGRRFLVGDRFTAADLTFATLAVPVLLPAGGPLEPPPGALPPAAVAVIEELRTTPAGQLVQRLYAEERRRVVG